MTKPNYEMPQINAHDLLSQVTMRITEVQSSAFQHRISISEETITELLVLELKRIGGDAVHISAHSKPQENKTGADLELIFFDATMVPVKYTVQAKRLYASNRYEAIRNNMKQCSNLIEGADQTGATPIYLFYNILDSKNEEIAVESWRFKKGNEAIGLFGCTVFDAEKIRDMIENKATKSFLSLHTADEKRFCLLKDLPYDDSLLPDACVSDNLPITKARAAFENPFEQVIEDAKHHWDRGQSARCTGSEERLLPPRFAVAISTKLKRTNLQFSRTPKHTHSS